MEDQGPLVVDIEAPVLPDQGVINVPCRHNPTLGTILKRVNEDIELHTLWKCANINAVNRLGMSDHGRVHVQIVANIALRLLRLLNESGNTPGIVKDHDYSFQDAEIVVVMAALMHDLGIAVHRDEHEAHSLYLAEPKIKSLLEGIYDIEKRTVVTSEVLHAIVAHAREARVLTVEAGVLKVSDALDMAKGRSRIPFEAGKVNIHSLSAAAIERIIINKGQSKPVRIEAIMNNSAGIFQLDELLKGKLHKSGLEEQIEVVARLEGQAESKLLAEYRMD
jgi:metal-dependent HD superfamily phosphatase/phosphodiesterase